jgi:hypothetical protein
MRQYSVPALATAEPLLTQWRDATSYWPPGRPAAPGPLGSGPNFELLNLD